MQDDAVARTLKDIESVLSASKAISARGEVLAMLNATKENEWEECRARLRSLHASGSRHESRAVERRGSKAGRTTMRCRAKERADGGRIRRLSVLPTRCRICAAGLGQALATDGLTEDVLREPSFTAQTHMHFFSARGCSLE